MDGYMTPFTKHVDLTDGSIAEAADVQVRHLSDMRGLFADSKAEAALAERDPVIYRVYDATDIPKREGQLRYSTTVIYPGKVGREYFMTKGHYHAKGDRAELYYCLKGEGHLLLQTPEGQVDAQLMTPGAATYVPPHWGHRTVNSGAEPFVFLAVYPADAGYDYGAIAENGFAACVVDVDGRAGVVSNPAFASRA